MCSRGGHLWLTWHTLLLIPQRSIKRHDYRKCSVQTKRKSSNEKKEKGCFGKGNEEGVREINLRFVATNQKPLLVIQTAVQADNVPRTRARKFIILGTSFNTSIWQVAFKVSKWKRCSYLPQGNLLLQGKIMQVGERGGRRKLDTEIINRRR